MSENKVQRVWWIAMLDCKADGSIDPARWPVGVGEDDQFDTEAEAIAAAKGACADEACADASFTVYRVEAVAQVTRSLSPPRVTRLDGKKVAR